MKFRNVHNRDKTMEGDITTSTGFQRRDDKLKSGLSTLISLNNDVACFGKVKIIKNGCVQKKQFYKCCKFF